MEMGASSILLMMVSLEALLLVAAAGSSSVAAVSGSTIRLPSDARGLADAQQAVAVTAADKKASDDDDEKRPWECCDIALCQRSIQPFCVCMDLRCSDNCKKCEETEDSRHVCVDKYPGSDPGPRCHEYGNGRGGLADAVQAAAAAAVMADDRNAGGDDDDEKGGGHERARRLARGHRF